MSKRQSRYKDRFEKYELISDQHLSNRKNMYVDLYIHRGKNNYTSIVIVCNTYNGNRHYYCDINQLNSFNVYVSKKDLIDEAYALSHFKSFNQDITHLDKLVYVHFNIMKIMNIFNDMMNKITHSANYDVIASQIEEGSSSYMDCFYQLCIQGLRPQLVNFTLQKNKLKELFGMMK